jgi:hypothetical protein
MGQNWVRECRFSRIHGKSLYLVFIISNTQGVRKEFITRNYFQVTHLKHIPTKDQLRNSVDGSYSFTKYIANAISVTSIVIRILNLLPYVTKNLAISFVQASLILVYSWQRANLDFILTKANKNPFGSDQAISEVNS